MYLLTINGQAIIEKPITLKELIETFGTVLSLEIAGFRIVKVAE